MTNCRLIKLIVILVATFTIGAYADPIPNFSEQTKPATSPVAISSEPQLFIDDYLIAASSKVRKTTHSPRRFLDHPILGAEHGTTQPYLTVIRDPQSKRFRMWYNKILGATGSIAYAESADGIHWETPSLGILGDNNELIRISTVRTGYGVSVIDDGPTAQPANERFKMAWWGQSKPSPGGDPGMRVAFSPDGLHWTACDGNPVLPDYSKDDNVDADDPRRPYGAGDIVDVFRDPYRNRYTALVKSPAIAADGYATGPRAGWYIRRLVSQSVSDDFRRWERPWRIAAPEARDPGLLEFYSVGGTIARGGLLIGFVRMLHDDYPATAGGPAEGIGYATLITSRDGRHWQRHDDVFFDRDPNPDAWDHAMTWIGCIVPVGEEDYVYYGGYKQGHKIEPLKERQIGLARMSRDRFVSRDARGRTGVLKTVALRLPTDARSRLALNADSPQSEIRVRVCNARTGNPIPGHDWTDCRPVVGDGQELPVNWQIGEQLAIAANQSPVLLEFQLENAALYGFRILPSKHE